MGSLTFIFKLFCYLVTCGVCRKKMRVFQGNWTEGLSSYSPSDWLRPGEGVASRGQSAAKAPISNGTTNADCIIVANEPSTNNQLTASNDVSVLEVMLQLGSRSRLC
jgi:hypothetical protein